MVGKSKDPGCRLTMAFCVLVFLLSACTEDKNVGIPAESHKIAGPLRVSTSNPRYFRDANGRTIHFTGSHTWDNLIDRRSKPDFDYTGYLGFLRSHNHNFIRLWTRETATQNPDDAIRDFYPLPYQRTGPGTAMDGKPKFDLTKFNPVYFSRLRSRVQEARDRGIYVMVMLFNGFSIHNKGGGRPNPWPGRPFNARNNVNGIDGDENANGKGEELHSLN